MSSARARATAARVTTSNGEPVEEIAAEPARLRRGRQVGIGGGDQADIDGQGLSCRRPARRCAVLDDRAAPFPASACEAAAISSRKSALPSASFEARGASAHRAGEGAGLVPEEPRCRMQRFGERRAVERDGEERLIPARREIGEARRDQLLAGAALAHHEDRPVERRQLGDLRQDRAERRRLPDQRRQLGIGAAVRVRESPELVEVRSLNRLPSPGLSPGDGRMHCR